MKALDSIESKLHLPVLNLSVALAAGTTHEQAMSVIDRVCSALNRQESSVMQLRIFLGKLMAAVQDRRLFAPAFNTFEEFIIAVANKHNLSRSTVRNSLMITRALPDLDPEKADKVPLTNLILVARVSKGRDKKEIDSIMKAAAKSSVIDFREDMEEKRYVAKRGRPSGPPRTTGKITLHIVVAARVAKTFRDRAGDDHGKYLAHLLSLDPVQQAA